MKCYAGDQIVGNEMGGHVAQIRERSSKYRALVRNLRKRDHFEDLCADEKNKIIILK
jgi:hypothetical protein